MTLVTAFSSASGIRNFNVSTAIYFVVGCVALYMVHKIFKVKSIKDKNARRSEIAKRYMSDEEFCRKLSYLGNNDSIELAIAIRKMLSRMIYLPAESILPNDELYNILSISIDCTADIGAIAISLEDDPDIRLTEKQLYNLEYFDTTETTVAQFIKKVMLAKQID